MALKAGPKTRRTRLDLSGLSAYLPQRRIEFMRRFCGVELYPWQRDEMHRVGGEKRPRVAYTQVARKNVLAARAGRVGEAVRGNEGAGVPDQPPRAYGAGLDRVLCGRDGEDADA